MSPRLSALPRPPEITESLGDLRYGRTRRTPIRSEYRQDLRPCHASRKITESLGDLRYGRTRRTPIRSECRQDFRPCHAPRKITESLGDLRYRKPRRTPIRSECRQDLRPCHAPPKSPKVLATCATGEPVGHPSVANVAKTFGPAAPPKSPKVLATCATGGNDGMPARCHCMLHAKDKPDNNAAAVTFSATRRRKVGGANIDRDQPQHKTFP
ncbi:hypothetical protein K227x_12860 [Rubripirellula lacrimiformis]|uniref:Uncharacterized protein n=1 Tax=Rubripirellula lacrimiformis TaxID=1930273 RepID=A0A517N6Z0_9BACT|nr:hypothetical protein K227x_12860 [Rubripirellula lacrimiformis]